MGSLMAGWNSRVLNDPDSFRADRSRSLTKEEIESYWRQYKKPEEDEEGDGKEVDSDGVDMLVMKQYSSSAPSYKDSFIRNWPAARKLQDKSGSPKSPRSPKTADLSELPGGGLPIQAANEPDNQKSDWWTRSTWAFLNEPPQERHDGSAHKYRPQFDVARIATAGRALSRI